MKLLGWYQRGFWFNRWNTDLIFCIHQLQEEEWEYSQTVQHVFIDLKKAYDPVRRIVLWNVWGTQETVQVIKMGLNETYSKVCIGTFVW
jgi:hypothetical protein